MSDYLVPEEILIEILLKLPVKSLIRGTSVCKQWQSLIRSSSFISTHLSNTENQVFLQRYHMNDLREYFMVIPKRGPIVINSASELEPPFKCQMGFSRIVGSCDGLVCLSHEILHRIIIWNPAIRNHLVLPRLVNPYNESHNVAVGFGVANNVYKVVRLVFGRNSQAAIFCLGGMGRWRKVTGFDVRIRYLDYFCCPIFFKGFLHWIVCIYTGEYSIRNSTVTFHVGDEVFGETMLPQELERRGLTTSLSFAVLGESLGAIKCDREIGNPDRCDVWMMKDYGVKESWTKLYSIDTARFPRVIGFRESDEVLLASHECELVTYNPETKGIKHVEVFGIPRSFHVVDYKESLLLLGGYSGDSGE